MTLSAANAENDSTAHNAQISKNSFVLFNSIPSLLHLLE